MKFLVLTLLLLSLTACNSTSTSEETTYEKNKGYGIPWEKDLDSAFKKAKEEKKILMVMAVSDNCQWCEKMKKKTLSESKVAKKLENYILVMADRETPSEKEQLHPFKHVPIIFFMTHEKDTLDELQGYFNSEDFLEYLIDFEKE
jgi:thioredoxin-related protein